MPSAIEDRYCGAKTRAGGACRQPAMKNGRCRLHGGKALRGAAHPMYKTGRYSKDFPDQLAARFEESLRDPELVELVREIALIDTRVGEMISELSSDAASAIFADLRKAWRQYKQPAKPGDAERGLETVGRLIEQGAEDWHRWQEIYDAIERRRRLVDSEAKRQAELKQLLTLSEAMHLINAFVEIVRENVKDKGALSRISAGITGLMAVEKSKGEA